LREARANRERIFKERAEERRAQGPSLIGSLAGAGIRGLHGLWTGAKNFWNDSIYDQLPEAAQNLSDFAGSAIDAGVQGARVGGMALGALGRGVNSFMNWASDKRNARVYGREQRDLARERFEQERQDYLANREANRATNPIFQRVQHTGRPEVPELPEAYTSGRLNLSSAMREEARLANERQQAEAQGLERVPEYIPGVGQDFNRGLQIVGRGVKGVYNNTIGAIGRWLGGGRQEGPRQAEVQPQTAPVPVREPNIPQVQEQPATAPVQPSTQPLVQQQPQTYTNPLNTPQPSFARTSADYLDPTDQTDDRNWAGFKVM
jgi:hypothetical protein